MSSEDVDSTTTPDTNNFQLELTSTSNQQKRKFSEENEAQCEDGVMEADELSKRPRTDDDGANATSHTNGYDDMPGTSSSSGVDPTGGGGDDGATSGQEVDQFAAVAGVVVKQEIKVEPPDDLPPDHQNDEDADAAAATTTSSDASPTTKVKVEVKEETDEVAVKAEASSSGRESCQYGIKCYRKNPTHRSELAHPGDSDYRRPSFPEPPLGTPDCPYGDRCYRRNPIHFQQFAHPPSTDFEKNYRDRKRQLRKRQPKKKPKNPDPQDEYESDFIDDEEENEFSDFSTDEDDEYIPGESESDYNDAEEI